MPGSIRSTVLLFAGLGLLSHAQTADTTWTPVKQHGHLSVSGGKIVDSAGTPVQLAGMSLYWSAWQSQFYNRATLTWLAYDWRISLVRIAMGVEGNGNYLDSLHGGDTTNTRLVDSVLQAAVDLGIYAIIDWHDNDAANHTPQAVAFFQRMSRKWGRYPNVLYEVWNEPVGAESPDDTSSTWTEWTWDLHGEAPDIRSYEQALVDTIRQIDTSNLILLGNASWDQQPYQAGLDPVVGKNLVYTLHFYSGSHPFSGTVSGNTNAVAQNGKNAVARKIPLLISEWGVSTADGGAGSTTIYTTQATDWLDWAATNKISWCNWSVETNNESAAALLPGASPFGWWDSTVISGSGKYVRGKIQAVNAQPASKPYTFPAPPPIPPRIIDTTIVPGRVQAEDYDSMSGIQTEATSDVDGIEDVGWIENGDWTNYIVNVQETGPYYLHARVASATSGGTLALEDSAGKALGHVSVPGTGDWQAWTTVTDSTPISLPVGLQRLRLSFQGVGTASLFNINWFQLDNTVTAIRNRPTPSDLQVTTREGSIAVRGAEGFDELTVLDPMGSILVRSPVVSGAATLPASRTGLVFAELSGPAGSRSLSLFVSR